MALTEGYWLGQDVVARANQVNVEHFVILNKTEDTLVVVACTLRAESNDYPLWGMWLNNTFSHWKCEHIALVADELEACWQVAVVDNVQKAIRILLHLDFSELYCLWRELDAVAISNTLAAELDLIATKGWHFE